MGDALSNQSAEHGGNGQTVMKRIAAAVTGLLIATPSAFADVDEANMFQDIGYIKATCIYNKFNNVDRKTARMLLKTVYKNHKSNQELVTTMFQQSLDAYPGCLTLFPEEIKSGMQTKVTKIPCQFNNGKWIQVESVDNAKTFTLTWDDGPKMTYAWVGSNADRWNITDKLGGKWNYNDHRTKGGFTLTHLDNGNKIKCLSTTR
jgi:hypothetical protein